MVGDERSGDKLSGKRQSVNDKRVPELDGIRAIAIWMVLGDHLVNGLPNPPGALDRVPKIVLFVIGHGWLGVDLFFVLSGFLITGILLDSRTKPDYFKNFYARRFLRIVPLYYTVLILMWLCYPGNSNYFLISILFLANFYYGLHISQPHGPGVFWSLAVEEHFYMLWPWLVFYLPRRSLTLAALTIVAAVPVLRVVGLQHGLNVENEIYSYSWFRFDGLALGALLAIWIRSPRANRTASLKLCLSMIAAAIVVTVGGIPWGILEAHSVLRYSQAQLIFGAFLLSSVSLGGSVFTSPLRWSFARLSSDLSYCVYLIHLAVGDAYMYFSKVAGFAPEATFGPVKGIIIRATIVLAMTFAIALLSRRFLEQPILKLKRYFEDTRQTTVVSTVT